MRVAKRNVQETSTQENIVEPQESTVEPQETKKDLKLFMLTDRERDLSLNYLKKCNINISEVFTETQDVIGVLMFEENDSRVIIVDTGKGKFTSSAGRAEIIDMLGSASENFKFTVFITDTALREEAKRQLPDVFKQIEWVRYRTMPLVALKILRYKENYIGGNTDTPVEQENYDIKFKGYKVNYSKEVVKASEGFVRANDIIDIRNIHNEMLSRPEENDLIAYRINREERRTKR